MGLMLVFLQMLGVHWGPGDTCSWCYAEAETTPSHGWEGGGLKALAVVVLVKPLGAGCEGRLAFQFPCGRGRLYLLQMRETPGFITSRDSVHVLALDSIKTI